MVGFSPTIKSHQIMVSIQVCGIPKDPGIGSVSIWFLSYYHKSHHRVYTLACCHAVRSIFICTLNLLLHSSNFSTESSYPCIGKFNCLDPDVGPAFNGELEWRSWRVPSDTTGSGIRTEQELCHPQQCSDFLQDFVSSPFLYVSVSNCCVQLSWNRTFLTHCVSNAPSRW